MATEPEGTTKSAGGIGKRIDEVFLFVAGPEDDEGIVGVQTNNGWLPLLAADAERVDSLRPLAGEIAVLEGVSVRLLRFTTRTLLEELPGDDGVQADADSASVEDLEAAAQVMDRTTDEAREQAETENENPKPTPYPDESDRHRASRALHQAQEAVDDVVSIMETVIGDILSRDYQSDTMSPNEVLEVQSIYRAMGDVASRASLEAHIFGTT